jgi:hypothetical protein
LTRVKWDSRGLEIEASNSSLNQILRQIATTTGAKLEGLRQDQRIFGTYGPGPASDVLLQLLDGSGYNLVMIGGRGADPPLEIALSARSLAAAKNVSRAEPSRAEVDAEPDPPPDAADGSAHAEQPQNPFTNGNADLPQDPSEFMQAVLQRQQKADEQQQQEQERQNAPQ